MTTDTEMEQAEAAIEELAGIRARIEAAVRGVPAKLHAAEAELEQFERLLKNAENAIAEWNGGIAELVEKLSSVRDGVGSVGPALEEFTGEIASQMQHGLETLGTLGDLLTGKQAEVAEAVTDRIEEMEVQLKTAGGEGLATVMGHVEDAVDALNEAADEIEELAGDLFGSALAAGGELLTKVLPEGITEKAKQFMEAIECVQETCANGVGKAIESVDQITGKVEVVIQAVEAVKPALAVIENI